MLFTWQSMILWHWVHLPMSEDNVGWVWPWIKHLLARPRWSRLIPRASTVDCSQDLVPGLKFGGWSIVGIWDVPWFSQCWKVVWRLLGRLSDEPAKSKDKTKRLTQKVWSQIDTETDRPLKENWVMVKSKLLGLAVRDWQPGFYMVVRLELFGLNLRVKVAIGNPLVG